MHQLRSFLQAVSCPQIGWLLDAPEINTALSHLITSIVIMFSPKLMTIILFIISPVLSATPIRFLFDCPWFAARSLSLRESKAWGFEGLSRNHER